MRVYRVCSAQYAHLNGEGARIYGGRWNSPGTAIVYTASSLALAILETRVHLQRMPIDYVRLTIEISDTVVAPDEVTIGDLDPGWRTDTALTRRVGDTHFLRTPLNALKVPSVVVDTEWNLLFSNDYARAHASITDKRPIEMDPRLWNV
jgi:RES domain-containing protein